MFRNNAFLVLFLVLMFSCSGDEKSNEANKFNSLCEKTPKVANAADKLCKINLKFLQTILFY